jgi:hypothetical protein
VQRNCEASISKAYKRTEWGHHGLTDAYVERGRLRPELVEVVVEQLDLVEDGLRHRGLADLGGLGLGLIAEKRKTKIQLRN